MKVIEREFYISKLINVIGTPDIKIITGVRRSGKSKLLEFFKDSIRKNDKNANIIHINFNLKDFDNLKNSEDLYNYITDNYKSSKNNFILIDEVQMCNNFEKTINWLHAEEKYDIYITGSNAFLLSSDLATLFTGRTFKIEMFPFSFKEFNRYFDYKDYNEAFNKYILEGGMSGSYLYKTNEEKYEYLKEVYNALIIRDIQKKYKIRNIQLLDELNDFLMDNISNLTSSRNIVKELSKRNKDTKNISDKTIHKYIKYLSECRQTPRFFLEVFL